MTDRSPSLDADKPASFFDLQVTQKDSPALWPGAPPNWGEQVVAHVQTVAGQTGMAGRAYLNADEAMLHDPRNSERMRADCGITECTEARQRAVALLPWHIEPEDENSQEQKELAKLLTQVIRRTPRFVEMKRWLLEAAWYGRSGTAMQYFSDEICGQRRTVVKAWEPRNGDKFVFRYDDGTYTYDPTQIGIKVGIGNRGLNRRQVEYTSAGMVYWFNPAERKTFVLHKHMVEDGPFDDVRLTGRIHGVGIRTRIYWAWYAMVECLQRALEYLDRSAFGVELWRYPANNPKAKKDTEEAAKRNVGGGRSVVLVPTFPGEMADLFGVEHIEPGLAGVDRLLTVIKEFFQLKIKRYILGQTLTSEADSTGLGSGVADAHMATFADIVQYDAQNLDETLTTDFLRPLQHWNFPRSRKHYMRFVIDTESPEVDKKLKALKACWDMGLELRASDLCDAAGVSMPTSIDAKVFNPQIVQAIKQLGIGLGPTAPPAINPGADPIAQAIRGVSLAGGQKPEVIHG